MHAPGDLAWPVTIAGGVVVLAILTVSSARADVPDGTMSRALGKVLPAVRRDLAGAPQPIGVDGPDNFWTSWYRSGLLLALQQDGVDITAPDAEATHYGSHYANGAAPGTLVSVVPSPLGIEQRLEAGLEPIAQSAPVPPLPADVPRRRKGEDVPSYLQRLGDTDPEALVRLYPWWGGAVPVAIFRGADAALTRAIARRVAGAARQLTTTSTPVRWPRNTAITSAVAPQTVSPATSKKYMVRSVPNRFQRSRWCASGSSNSESATSKTRSTSAGAGVSSGRPSTIPTKGAIANAPPTLGSWSSAATISTISGASPISSCASRSAAAAASASTAGSTFPPGNAMSPWWVGRCSGRRGQHEAGLAVILEDDEEHRGVAELQSGATRLGDRGRVEGVLGDGPRRREVAPVRRARRRPRGGAARA